MKPHSQPSQGTSSNLGTPRPLHRPIQTVASPDALTSDFFQSQPSATDQAAPVPRPDWRHAPRGTAPSPLQRILGRPVVLRSELTQRDYDRLRTHAMRMVPQIGCEDLDAFFLDLIADDDVLWALFRPTPKTVFSMGRTEIVQHLPFDRAIKAAGRAQKSGVLLPHERAAAWAAGFALAIGAFAAACPCLKESRTFATLRAALLAEPLKQLRRRNSPLASTLGAALGCEGGDECDPGQVSRIAAAARTANLDSRMR